MPPLLESLMTTTATSKFRSFNLTLPSLVSLPGGRPPNVAQYLLQSQTPGGVIPAAPVTIVSPSVTSGLRVATVPTLSTAPTLSGTSSLNLPNVRPTATPMSVPPALFKSASNDSVDVAFQQEASAAYSTFITGICHAIAVAHDTWRATAFIGGATIMGPNVNGASIAGPALSSQFVVVNAPPATALWGSAATATQPIADGLAGAWLMWAQSVRVPGLPWYPQFAAYPAPVAPPTPNVPCPLAMLTSNQSILMEGPLATAMTQRVTQAAPYGTQVIQAVAAGFAAAVAVWITSQSITNAMGQGAVPTFAPPYVPVAPVVGAVLPGLHFVA